MMNLRYINFSSQTLSILFLSSFLSFSVILSLKAQTTSLEGQQFWLGFLQNANGETSDIRLFITTSAAAANVDITINGTAISGGTVTVDPSTGNGSTEVILTAAEITLATPSVPETVENRGISITSDENISVAAMHATTTNSNSDATSLIPTTAFGDFTEYFVASYEGTSTNPSQFVVVATEDNTEIFVTPSVSTSNGSAADTEFSVTLNQGQSYWVRADAFGDLTGSKIESCNPVAVFSGVATAPVVSGGAPCLGSNHLFTQLPPTNLWSTRYFATPLLNVNSEYAIRIVSSTDNNTIVIDSTSTIPLNEGQFTDRVNLQDGICISSSFPVMAIQYLKSKESGCNNFSGVVSNPSMMVLSPATAGLTEATFTSSSRASITDHFVTLIVQNDTPANITLQLDGTDVTPNYISFDPCNDYVWARLTLPNTGNSRHSLTSNSNFVAYVFGYGADESYLYPAATNLITTTASIAVSDVCPNSPLTFQANGSTAISQWTWDFGDGSEQVTDTGTLPAQTTHTYAMAGMYTVNLYLETEKGCLDTVTNVITITDITPAFTNPIIVCPGDTVTVNAGTFDSYLWSDGSTASSLAVNLPGDYSVTLTQGNCTQTFPLNVQFNTEVNTTFSMVPPAPSYLTGFGENQVLNSIVCEERNESFQVFAGEATSTVVWATPDGLVTSNSITVNSAGTYTASVTDANGCTDEATIVFENGCEFQLFVPEAFSPNGDGINDSFEIFGTAVSSITFAIYNRWGEVIFYTEDKNATWDGTINGADAPAGTYIWKTIYRSAFESNNVIEETGSLVIVR